MKKVKNEPKNRRGPLFYIQKPQVFEYKKVISRFLGYVLKVLFDKERQDKIKHNQCADEAGSHNANPLQVLLGIGVIRVKIYCRSRAQAAYRQTTTGSGASRDGGASGSRAA